MDKKEIVIAVVGCGRIANNAHFPSFEKIDGLRVKYACDLILEKAQAMKEKFSKIENVITDYKIALADEEVDAVYVLTPNYAHYTVAMDSLRAGKHVMCEKPITVNYAMSLEMAEEAAKQNKILSIGVCNRYNRAVEMLADYYKEGKFGNLYHVYCSFRGFRSIPGLGGAFTTKSQSGGGVIIDQAIHSIDLVNWIIGSDIESVSVSMANRGHSCVSVEDSAEGLITYKNGVRYGFYCMNNYACDEPIQIKLYCENCKIVFGYDDAVIEYNDGTREEVHSRANAEIYDGGKDYWGFQHVRQISQFYDACLKDE